MLTRMTTVFKRLVWLGPTTIALSTVAVFVVQRMALLWFAPLPREYAMLRSLERSC